MNGQFPGQKPFEVVDQDPEFSDRFAFSVDWG